MGEQIVVGRVAHRVARGLGLALALAVAVAPQAARAQCADTYTVDAMVEDLVAVETFLRNSDDDNAGKAADALRSGLGCMTEVMPRMIAGRALRAVGSGLVAGGDPDGGKAWLRTAAELEPSFDFGLEDVPESHPVRGVYDAARSTASGDEVPVAGASLAMGTAYLDGRKLLEPKARADRWHLFQLDSGTSVRSWVIEGNAFPDDGLVLAPTTTAKKPKPTKDKDAEVATSASTKTPKPAPTAKPNTTKTTPVRTDARVVGVRDRPKEKTPLMLAGGLVVGGGGVLYYLSYATHQKFVNYTPGPFQAGGGTESVAEGELRSLYGTTNRLMIASIAVAAVGVGTFTWGAILDGSGAPIPAIHVRF